MAHTTAQASCTVADGVITNITITNPGLGYLAPPLVSIVGTGAGAKAVATLGAQGTVSSITISDGGSGYRPSPPTMYAALAIINTGYAINLLYR